MSGTDTVVDLPTEDGLTIRLTRDGRGVSGPKGPVMLVHGAGVRSKIFRPPVKRTVVNFLIEDGYDVWLLDWRASIDLPRVNWTLDQAAAYDHPLAVRAICERTGAKHIKAVIHCQGSTSFMLAAVAGLLPQVSTIVSNAVSLHTIVPKFSAFKLSCVVPSIKPLTSYMDPAWGNRAPGVFPKLTNLIVSAFHHECHNQVCKQVSFTYGTGFPALWEHVQLSDETHEWIRGEFGFCPLTFFDQMSKCVRRGNLVSVSKNQQLPADACGQPPKTRAYIALLSGRLNKCFLTASQERSYQFLAARGADTTALHIFEGYSHLDIFLGSNSDIDVFPTIAKELARGEELGGC